MKTVLKLTRIALFDFDHAAWPDFQRFCAGSILSGAPTFAVGCFAALSGCLAYCFTTSRASKCRYFAGKSPFARLRPIG